MHGEVCRSGYRRPCENGLKLLSRLQSLHLQATPEGAVSGLPDRSCFRQPDACGLWRGAR
jgi:hypothetical protein